MSESHRHRKRAEVSHAEITGEELLARALKIRPGVSKARLTKDFADLLGRNERTVDRWFSGAADGDIPLWIESVLAYLETSPEWFAADASIDERLEDPFMDIAEGMRSLGPTLRHRDYAAALVTARAIANSYRQLADQIEAMHESA